VKRPSWFQPVRGLGEWVGFLGGIVVAAAVIAFAVLLVKGIANHVSVSVRNDSHATVEISDCTDDPETFGPGEVFHAGGVPEHGELACFVAFGEGPARCIAIPRVRSIHRTIALSQLVVVPSSKC
jgi:hypothetical protein